MKEQEQPFEIYVHLASSYSDGTVANTVTAGMRWGDEGPVGGFNPGGKRETHLVGDIEASPTGEVQRGDRTLGPVTLTARGFTVGTLAASSVDNGDVTRSGRKIGTARRKERRDAEGTDHVTFGIELFVTVEDDDRAQLVVGLTALLEKHAKDQGWFGH